MEVLSNEKMCLINELSKISSRNLKFAFMKEHPELKGVFKACYHPHWHYYIKPTQSWCTDSGLDNFDDNTTKLLIQLMNRTLSGAEAKRRVKAELSRLNPLSQELLLRILNKDMKCGVSVKTANIAWEGLIPEFEVQLAKLYETGKMAFPCICSPKIDGLRCIYENGKLYSRNGKELFGLNKILNAIKAVAENMAVTRIDGELTVQGKTFDDLSGDIRAFKESDNAVYNVFDIHIEKPVELQQRLAMASLFVTHIDSANIRYVPHISILNEDELFRYFNIYRDMGYEGLVVKNPHGLPYNGRNWLWQKIKPQDTVDLVVCGIDHGEGKYEGMVGALVCEYGDQQVRVGGGLSDEQRRVWAEDTSMIIGKTIEVEYMETSKFGKLRHPRLKCVRGDK